MWVGLVFIFRHATLGYENESPVKITRLLVGPPGLEPGTY